MKQDRAVTVNEVRRRFVQGMSCLMIAGLGACAAAPSKSALDIGPLAQASRTAIQQAVLDQAQGDAVLTSEGMADPAQRKLVLSLISEILADLTLFGAEATARPKDVRIVVLGQGAADTLVSLRTLPLYRSVADALNAGALSRLAIADRVLESRVAAISADALDSGRKINGAVITVVMQGLAQDGAKLIVTE